MSKILNFLRENKTWLAYLFIFVFSFCLLLYLQANPSFADPDSFYHVKMAQLIRDHGIVKDFPWLQFTVLKDYYTDQHFLYHVLLIPFVTLLNPIIGAKLATVMLGSLLVILFCRLLNYFKVKLALIFSLILLLITPFTFRISLVKAPSTSILILILAIYLIFRHKYLWLFLLSFIYVWTYGGFLLILVFAGLYSIVGLLADLMSRFKARARHVSEGNIFSRIFKNKNIKLFFSSLGGVLAGLVINPFFPNNLYFYWHQLVKIGIINYQKIIGVGNEWYPYKFIELVSNAVLLSIILVITLILFFINYKKQSRRSVMLFFIFIFFLLLTLKSRRYVEYYVPFALLFGAFSLNDSLTIINWRLTWQSFLQFYFRRKVLTTVILVYILVTIPTIILRDINSTKRDLDGGSPYYKFQKSSQWLVANSQPGDIVFHSSWDEFPVLFYHNAKDYYIIGLDPTFMYDYNKDLYWKMVDITTGKPVDNLSDVLTNDFKASFIFVEINHTGMNNNIKNNTDFTEVYRDEEAIIYKT